MPLPVRFTPGFWPTIGAAALVSLTLWLGHWQTARGDEKQARQDLFESRMREPTVDLRDAASASEALLYRRVRATGEYLASGQIFVDNQVFEGRAGFRVVTPLKIEGGGVVLVERGWIERTAQYPAPPRADPPAGRNVVTGIAALPPRRYIELAPPAAAGPVWQNLSIERYRETTREAVLPFVLVADYAAPGLQAIRERPDAGVERHREYSLTWYSLAATTFVLWIVLNLRRAP